MLLNTLCDAETLDEDLSEGECELLPPFYDFDAVSTRLMRRKR